MQYKTQAIILSRKDYRENDKLVTFYTCRFGQIKAVVRGGKKILSKMGSYTEPFYVTQIMFASGRGLNQLAGIDLIKRFDSVYGDLNKMKLVGKTFKLIEENTREESDADIYNLILEYLEVINNLSAKSGAGLFLNTIFVLKFIDLLGYPPELYTCVICKKKVLPGKNKFDFLRGGLVCGECDSGDLTVSDSCVKVLRLPRDKELKEFLKLKVSKSCLEEVIKLTDRYLQFIFEK